MRMSVKQLRAFLAVAHTLNFAHASERLNLSQPALSLTIKGLEEALGGALLQRSTRKVTLTQEGELFLPMARQLLADWDNVEEAMRQSFTLQRGKNLGRRDAVVCRQRSAGGAESLSRPLCRGERYGA
ncbi:LysR family transcriptional regulator [Klebsiella pneumoniae]|nr:LysR family transcriptional regulator [Klebsiella pneumoniae]SYH40542.1 LysR family transcriptional regulator [Klebsiella pneumoniae]